MPAVDGVCGGCRRDLRYELALASRSDDHAIAALAGERDDEFRRIAFGALALRQPLEP